MPAPENIQPQTPGETAAAPNPLIVLLDGNVPEVADALPGLSDDQLRELADLEAANSNRKGVTSAVADELEARRILAEQAAADEAAQAAAAPEAAATVARANPSAASVAAGPDGVVRTTDQASPVLTDAGWVVPEPPAGAGAKGN